MGKEKLAFSKINFIMLAISMIIVIIGLILMAGSGSTEEAYNPDIFSPMRIKVAPIITFVGFLSMIVAILWKQKK
ncbi:MAG: DUF3098 domain-containing protein [Bacteroidaceae bacterium]|nr:DUF3098 domain-containing protein [Bacteroidaceae bacterium]